MPTMLDNKSVAEKTYVYAATDITVPEKSEVMPVPVIAGMVVAVRWAWVAQTPWWYFATQEPLDGLDVAPATYPNGNPVELPEDPDWQEPQK